LSLNLLIFTVNMGGRVRLTERDEWRHEGQWRVLVFQEPSRSDEELYQHRHATRSPVSVTSHHS